MTYILLTLQVLTALAEIKSTPYQWFLTKEGGMKDLDSEYIFKLDTCLSNYKLKYYNETHCLVEFYNEVGCNTLSGEIEYWSGNPLNDIENYAKVNGYYYHIYYEDKCKTPFLYVIYTKKNCNYEADISTGEKYYAWYEPQNNKLKRCSLVEDEGACTDNLKEHCSIYDVEQCINNQMSYINYEKFDNGITPTALLTIFCVLMLFL